jgi:uncharacterized protein
MSARTYPHGVPCWVDLAQPDLDAATRFYGALFGWEFADAMPPDAPGSYLIATRDGEDAAALSAGEGSLGWVSYIACDDADATAALVGAAGGNVLEPPEDAGPGGRAATCSDPQGAVFRVWQARRRLGAQAVNVPGAWNFSDLHTPDPSAAMRFYLEVFGWVVDPHLGAGMIRLPGYGDHLASTSDPGIHERQAFAPEGFADVVAALVPAEAAARWWVRFAVADRDVAASRAESLGAEIASSTETDWTREAVVVDPQGARFVVSQLVIPD